MKAPPLNRQILKEASDWFVDFRVGDVDGSSRERFDEWLRQSPEHIRAYWEIAKGYVELPDLMSVDTLNVDELIAGARAEGNVIPLRPSAPTPVSALGFETGRPQTKSRFGQPRIWAAAAVVLMLVTSAIIWQTPRHPLYVTEIGERRSVTLADGSTVDLNARSKLRIEFSNAERRVELLEGQALFQVAKDKARPFIVRSGEATVRAVGTEFDVYRKETGTTVTVLEGRVAVYSTEPQVLPATGNSAVGSSEVPVAAPGSGSPGQGTTLPVGLADPARSAAVYLSAGEQVTVSPGIIDTPHHTDSEAVSAWMQRKLIFHGTKLSEVVEEFNRYNRTPLVIADPALTSMEISGVYSSKDPASLLRFLQDQGVTVQERRGEVRLERK